MSGVTSSPPCGLDLLNTIISGSPPQIRTAGDWLIDLGMAIMEAGLVTFNVRLGAASFWWGSAADAYQAKAIRIMKSGDAAGKRAAKQGDVLRAFADQVSWRQQDMDDIRKKAKEGGLTLVYEGILVPPDVPYLPGLPAGCSWDEVVTWETAREAHNAAVAKVDLFKTLEPQVLDVRTRFARWIEENLRPESVDSFIANVIQNANKIDVSGGVAVDVATDVAEQRLKNLEDGAMALKEAQAKSQNAPPDSSWRESITTDEKVLEKAAQVNGVVGRFGGPVLAAGIGAYDIARGESPTSVGSGFLSGLAGAWAAEGVGGGVASAAGGGVLAAAAASAIATASGAVVVGASGAWVWTHLVSLENRDKIDEGLRDIWNKIASGASDLNDSLAGA